VSASATRPHRRTAPPGGARAEHPAPGSADLLRSEWSKLWSVRTTWILFGVLLLLTVGLSAVLAFFGSSGDLAESQAQGEYDVIFFSATLGVWIYTYIAATVVAGEYGDGVGQYTFVATPRRGRVLAAKVLIIAGVGMVAGLVVALSNLLLTQTALAAGGFATLDLTDPAFWRAVLTYVPLSMVVQAVLGGLVAALTRNAVGALVVVILLNAIPVTLAPFLGEAYRTAVPRLVPGAAVESVAGLARPGSDGHLPLGTALAVIALWIGASWFVAAQRTVRGDVR
jgi:ABC-2 type transport system permease protein